MWIELHCNICDIFANKWIRNEKLIHVAQWLLYEKITLRFRVIVKYAFQ